MEAAVTQNGSTYVYEKEVGLLDMCLTLINNPVAECHQLDTLSYCQTFIENKV